ncbi:MAG: hypothetical protein MK110_14885 [Fuerstiella sp.]|nr:hypothetical protein [Fuerstiella sp.]
MKTVDVRPNLLSGSVDSRIHVARTNDDTARAAFAVCSLISAWKSLGGMELRITDVWTGNETAGYSLMTLKISESLTVSIPH